MERIRSRQASSWALPWGIALLLGGAVRFGLTAAFDRTLLLAMAPSAWIAPIASAITWFGDSLTRIVVVAVAVLVLLVRRERRRALALVLIVAVGAALDSAIKAIVGRPRPALLPHFDHVTSASFPSGHAANGTILYLALALLVPARYRAAAMVFAVALALAIGVSRVALAVHWPSDVLAGWCFGLGWVLLWRDRLVTPTLTSTRG